MSQQERHIMGAEQRALERRHDLQSLLGSAPLLEGEDAAAYDELQRRVYSAVTPADILEEIWVRDVVDLVWETMRLRRLKAKLMQSASHEGLERLLKPLTGYWSNTDLVNDWVRRDRDAIKKVNSLLKQAGLDQEAIAAQTLAAKLDGVERIDRMIMQTEARRNAVLREVDRHREALARRLREAAAIEDAEFTELAPPQRDAAE
jgi:hypothetical protein